MAEIYHFSFKFNVSLKSTSHKKEKRVFMKHAIPLGRVPFLNNYRDKKTQYALFTGCLFKFPHKVNKSKS